METTDAFRRNLALFPIPSQIYKLCENRPCTPEAFCGTIELDHNMHGPALQ